MWEFLTSVVVGILSLAGAIVGGVFGLAGEVIGTILSIPIFGILIGVCIILLPFLLVGGLIALCLHDKNTPALDPAIIDNLSLKLQELEITHGKKLELDENKLTNVVTLIQKLKNMHESNDKLSKSEIKEIKKEMTHEIKALRMDLKSQYTASEFKTIKKAIKKELKHEFKTLPKSSLFHHTKLQKKVLEPSVIEFQPAASR